ncbi:MAG: LamG-like jellyroll fold domain-containing protein [Bacteroidia bacterium]
MKTLSLAGLCLLYFCVPLAGQSSLQDSLILWYDMDANVLDLSGNNNHAILFGPTPEMDRNGNPNSAFRFNGQNDYMIAQNQQKLQPQLPVSMSAWVYIEDYNLNNVFRNCFQTTLYNGIIINIVNGYVQPSIGGGGPTGFGARRSKTGASLLALNTWYHIACVIRGPLDMDIFINGKRDCGTYSGGGGPLNYISSDDGRIGEGSSINNTFYKGIMDEIRFYNRELDKSEIRILADFPPQDTTFCQGDSLQLDAGYGSLISWTPSSNLSCTNCPSPIASPIQSTVYTAITENTIGCPDTVDISIITKTCPTAGPCDTVSFNLDFTTQVNGTNITIIDQSTIPQNAQMDVRLGDGNNIGLSPGDTISYTYATAGIYTVCLEAVLALGETLICSDTLCDTVEVISTAIESNTFAQAVMVYPNPATKYLKLEFPKPPGQNTTIKLFNMQGILVQEWTLENQQSHQLNLSPLPKAYYHLNISGSTTFFGSRLILIK